MERELAEIVKCAVDGDEWAWEALVDRYASLIWAIARGHSLSYDDAADVSQATWTRLAEAMETIREPHRIGAWLATTARREALRVLRHQERHVGIESCVEATCTKEDPAETSLIEKETHDELWEAFESLSGPCKALLRALLAEPTPSYEEVSSAFGMPVGSIGPTRARCLDRLRHRVEPSDHEGNGNQAARPVAVTHRRRVS